MASTGAVLSDGAAVAHPDALRDLGQVEKHLANLVRIVSSRTTLDGMRRCRQRTETERVGFIGKRTCKAPELRRVALELGVLKFIDTFCEFDDERFDPLDQVGVFCAG